MRSIQDVGLEILSGVPKNFYVFCGSEYGIKLKYIESLKDHYNGRYECYQSVKSVLDIMRTKHIIPLSDKLYVIRYDESFISSLSDRSESYISSCKILGTIVCIYEDEKQCQKISKFLPNYSVEISKVSDEFIFKYLKNEFKSVPDRLINLSIRCGKNYFQSRNICYCISNSLDDVKKFGDYEILDCLGYHDLSDEKSFRIGFASRNYMYCLNMLDKYDNLDNIYYMIFQILFDLDKLKDNRSVKSDIRNYADKWSRSDIYNMFHYTYQELKKSRSMIIDSRNSIVFLISLIAYESVPTRGVFDEI